MQQLLSIMFIFNIREFDYMHIKIIVAQIVTAIIRK